MLDQPTEDEKRAIRRFQNKLSRDLRMRDPAYAEKIRMQKAEWRARNPDKIREMSAKQTARPEVKARRSQRVKERRASDPEYAFVRRLRSRLSHVKLGRLKDRGTMSLCGIDSSGLKSYFESKFLPGMSWENATEWHIDHIHPIASFDLSDPAQVLECFHYTNLQPLWAIDNLRKGCGVQTTT